MDQGAEPSLLGQARLVWAAGAELGEGATWDAHAARLWWVDIRGGPYTVPNGPAFSPDGRVMYCADSPAGVVYAFDVHDGRPARKREFVRFAEGEGHPDGMTVDAEACLWVAHWGGGRVSRFAPDGRRLGRIEVPTERVTSCAFGGADLRTLFITSAGGTGSAGAGPAGGVFAAKTTVAGLLPGRMRLAEAPGGGRR